MTEERPRAYLEPMTVRGRIARPQPKGLPVIGMGYNELPYGPSPHVMAAIEAAARDGNRYGAPGCDAVREALGEVHGLDPEAIICGNGSEELIDVIARNFARAGDEVLIPEFGYIQFAMTARRVGATLVKAPESGFTTDIDAMLAAVTTRTRLIFVANPNNPTGTLVPVAELERLVDGVPPSVVVVLDLAYGEFSGAGYCAAVHRLVGGRENVIVLRTFSKAFGLAGLRLGWAHAPEWMMPGFYAARGMGSVNRMAQMASLAAIEDRATMEARVSEIVSERDRVAGVLAQKGVRSCESGTNFLMAGIEDGGPEQVEALVEWLFDEGGIVVNRTREAGLERFFRFSLGTPDQNDLLISCVTSFLEARG